MNLKNTGGSLFSHIGVAALASAVTYVVCMSLNDGTIAELNERISSLEAKERNAIVTQRISEQMEEIAFQQKSLSDQQRERAEEQSRIADMERGKAQMEQRAARQAEFKAIRSARQADSMRVVAEHQSDLATHHMMQAEASRAKADTLFYNSLGRSLAQTSIAQYNSGNKPLAALLSYSAWQFTTQYGGNVYQQDVFTALVKNSGADFTTRSMTKGDIRSLHIMQNSSKARAIIAVSDYGEIILVPTTLLTPWSKAVNTEAQTLLSDSQYDFRSILGKGTDECLALDINGNIASIKYGESTSCNVVKTALPADKWNTLLDGGNGSVIAVGRKAVAWINSTTYEIIQQKSTGSEITAAGTRADGTLLLFCKDGSVTAISNDMQSTKRSVPFTGNDIATAYIYFPRMNFDIIGTESGQILICDTEGNLQNTLIGHTGRISHLETFSRMVMSSAYDNTIKTWDMANLNSMIVFNEVKYNDWPLCFLFDQTTAMLQIGFQGGDIHTLCISSKANAQHARGNITREFTPEEWNYYIGKEVEYKTFMP